MLSKGGNCDTMGGVLLLDVDYVTVMYLFACDCR